MRNYHERKSAFLLGVVTVFNRHGEGYNLRIEALDEIVRVYIDRIGSDATERRSFYFAALNFDRDSFYEYGEKETAAALQRLGAEFITLEQAQKEAQ